MAAGLLMLGAPRAQAWYNPPQDNAARWRQWTKDYWEDESKKKPGEPPVSRAASHAPKLCAWRA